MDEERNSSDAVDIPWQTGVFDAHCHPTDTMTSIDDISNMKAKVLTIMATRQEDQELVSEVARRYPLNDKDQYDDTSSRLVVPAFGWHPWFSYQIFDDQSGKEKPDATVHYKNVLIPNVEDEAFLRALPAPKSLTEFLAETEDKLRKHPFALIGEVGLDRSFRLPNEWRPREIETRDPSVTPGSREGRRLSPYRVQLAHQKVILEAQLQLAAKLNRSVSVHSVQAHGAVYEVLQKLWSGHERMSSRQRKRRSSAAGAHAAEEDEKQTDGDASELLPFPPRICMHSYSGPEDFLKQFLHNTVPVDVYFSFSEVINFSNSSTEKVTSVISAVPDSRILMESDLHIAGVEMDNRLGLVFQRICNIKKWSPEEGVKILGQNWRSFVFGG
jgi:Tat protein secretion system quality control protein TatD with DNase activity